jgi:hypothetical protein
VIHALKRKPMALLNLVYRDQLFPRAAYRETFEVLCERLPARTACKTMVTLLALAHERTCEAALAVRLRALLEAGELPDLTTLREAFAPDPGQIPTVCIETVPLSDYDRLLSVSAEVCA